MNGGDTLSDWGNYIGSDNLVTLMALLAKVGLSILSILIGCIAFAILKAVINKTLSKSKHITDRKRKTVKTLCYSVARYFVFFIVLLNILSIFGFNSTSLIAISGGLTVALGLGAQDLIQDILTGVFILTEDHFGVGDNVSLEGYIGKVESIGLRTTSIRSLDGDLILIPNGQIKIVTNMSKGFNRASVEVDIAYDENLENVLAILNDEVNNIFNSVSGLIAKPEVLGVTKLGESGVTIKIIADCEVDQHWRIEREIRLRVKNRLDNEGIVIPFPQCVVHIKEK